MDGPTKPLNITEEEDGKNWSEGDAVFIPDSLAYRRIG